MNMPYCRKDDEPGKKRSRLKSASFPDRSTAMPLSEHHCMLSPHPRTPAPMVRSLELSLIRGAGDDVTLCYRLLGDIARLRVPGTAACERCDGLWEHTCFEAFLSAPGTPYYREFNFSPAGHWAAFDFSDTRQVMTTRPELPPPQIKTQRSDGRLELEVRLDAGAIPARFLGCEWQLGISAVVETTDTLDDALSYWALAHSGAHPDFHHRDGFRLCVPVQR